MPEHVSLVMINHVASDIAASPDLVWQAIVSEYVEGEKFRNQGTVTPLDDPAVPLGSYRLRIEVGEAVDERVVQITERDEAARRLSIFADYLSVPGGMHVYASYRAHGDGDHARFSIDAHSRLAVEVPAKGSGALPAVLAAFKSQADEHLTAYAEQIRSRLEATG